MTINLKLNEYKQGIADLYNKRSENSELSKLSPSELKQAKEEFYEELEALETEKGIWNEVSTWYVLAHKP